MGLAFKSLRTFIDTKLDAEWPKTVCPIVYPLLNIDVSSYDIYMEPDVEISGSTQSEVGAKGLVRSRGFLFIKITSIKGFGIYPIMDQVDNALKMFQRTSYPIDTDKQVIFEEGIPDQLVEENDRAYLVVRFSFIFEQYRD
jgi:hypothetical protein